MHSSAAGRQVPMQGRRDYAMGGEVIFVPPCLSVWRITGEIHRRDNCIYIPPVYSLYIPLVYIHLTREGGVKVTLLPMGL